MKRYELSSSLSSNKQLLEEFQPESGVQLSDCYQCGKCSAGCPVAFAMDYSPNQIIRLLQLGMAEEALEAKTPWLCACCATCYTRCPKEVDLPALMDVLCKEGKSRGFIGEKTVDLFHELFLKSVEKNGRVHEMGLILQYNLSSGQFLKDAVHAPKLLFNGKISPFPHKIKNEDAVQRIFKRCSSGGGES